MILSRGKPRKLTQQLLPKQGSSPKSEILYKMDNLPYYDNATYLRSLNDINQDQISKNVEMSG